MEVTIGGADLRLELAPGATVGDLAAATGVVLDRPVDLPLAAVGLLRGSRVGAEPSPCAPPAGGGVVVVATGGLDAGRRTALPPGPATLGRGAGCAAVSVDPTVSRRHALLDVRAGTVAVTDLGSRNGTWVGGRPVGRSARRLPGGGSLRVGAAELAVVDVEAAAADAPVGGPPATPTAAGTVPFNRPPRPAPAPLPPPVTVPEPPAPPPDPPALGVVAVLGPLAMAAVLVVALGNPAFALLALLTPVLAVGSHLEGRRRARHGRRRDARRRRGDLDRLAAALAAACAAESARRLAEAPDPAEVLRRAALPSTRLWERRPGHPDAGRVRVGVGDVPWAPPLAGDRHPRPADVDAVVAAHAVLPATAVTVELGVVGVVGPRPAALAVARALLCQATVHHGPADLPVLVAVAPGREADWDWAKWLPHVDDPAGTGRFLAVGRESADAVADGAAGALLVVDGDELLEGRRSALRSRFAGGAAGIVVAGAVDRLPAACTAVVTVTATGLAEVAEPALGRRLVGVRADGIADDTAARCARALARFDDPELDVPGAGLPARVELADVLGGAVDAATVLARWRRPSAAAVVGLGADGPVEVDLAVDGPHALVAGTTGAGKSELLRTLVAGLALAASPDDLTFLLVDFKGGSAFDACARLPHVVGVVTDLDEDLAARALRCLDAELRRRERAQRADPGASPARLVVVVDEFATLKAELPAFVDALVGVAQRGRSLGVHLVLATQRPSGAVSDDIRANTNLRIALRVQDTAESVDVVGVPDAAALPRHRPGRACVRLGPGEVVAVQTVLTSSPAATGRRAPVRVAPFAFGGHAAPAPAACPGAGPTALERVVDACAAAWASTGRPAPRRPWPDPLPAVLEAASLPAGAVALADDPDHQRQVPLGWDRAGGNLAVLGVAGSGTTTTLLAVALALAAAHRPDELHLFAVDHGAGALAPLGGLPHTGAVIGATEHERQVRLVRRLRAELDRRRSDGGGCRPAVVVLVDGAAAFLARFADAAGLDVLDAFERVFADGPAVGIHVALTAGRPGAVPSALLALVRQRWVHRLADPHDAGAAGLAGRLPALVPGRFVDAASGLTAHTATPADGWPAAAARCAARWAGVPATAPPVGTLPASVPRPPSAPPTPAGAPPWTIPLGVADDDLGPAAVALWPGEHVLVAGPGRSGRTTALATIGEGALEGGARVLALAGPRSWLPSVDGVEAVAAPALRCLTGPTVVLVDDAELVDDDGGALEALVSRPPAGVHVVAAGRAEALRGLFAHWTRGVRRSRTGLLLRPHLDLDGELLGVVLPRRTAVPLVAGRGFLVADGGARLLQVYRP